ncbi:MAG: DHHA1 domain-containing protein [Treponemataceae bacterium]
MECLSAYARLVSALDAACDSDPLKRVLVQPHDDPDHDAVASAFGLARLLSRSGFAPHIRHRGRVRSHSLMAMVSELEIPLERVHCEGAEKIEDCPCIILDGSPTYSNAKPLGSPLLGVIDHHPNPGLIECPFVDNRVSYGACASIVSDYWKESGWEPDRACATALLMGIQMDTDFLSRRVSPADLDAHRRLFFNADWEFSTSVMKGSLSIDDLPALRLAAQEARIEGGIFFTVIPLDCTQEVISIMADFFLRLKEIALTVIVEAGGGRYHVSVRSKTSELSAAAIVRRALIGIGRGGGHDHMAGGVIEPGLYPGEESLLVRFVDAVEAAQENQ